MAQQYDKQFVDALIGLAFEENSPDFIIKLRNQAAQTLACSNGVESAIVSANLSGKSFGFRIERPAGQLFAECQEALRQYTNGTITVTQTDWWGYGFPWT